MTPTRPYRTGGSTYVVLDQALSPSSSDSASSDSSDSSASSDSSDVLGGSLLGLGDLVRASSEPRWAPRPRPRRPRSPRATPPRQLGRSLGLGGLGLLLAAGRLRVVLLGHQLDDRHRGVVALARTDLGDPGVATRALLEGRRDLGEQRVHDRLVVDGLQDLTPVVQVAPLGLGDQLLGDRPQHAGARLGGGDPAVLEQRRGEVREDQPLVGRAAAEAGTLLGSRHGVLSISPAV